jgi:hypothetical protein
MSEAIIVRELSVRVVTGDTVYRYERGFSGIYAEVISSDPSLVSALTAAHQEGAAITVRCAMLDVVGQVTKTQPGDPSPRFIISVDDLVYRKPTPTRAMVRRRRSRSA